MTEDGGLLRLLAWLSPAFPTGGFAYSHGLEWAIERGDARSTAGLVAWLVDILEQGSGRTDAILLRHSHRATTAEDWAALSELAELGAALPFGRERFLETTAQGRAFLLAAAAWPAPVLARLAEGDIAYPIAVGAVAAAHGVPEERATLGLLHAFAANLVSAAVRLVPLGQQAGLRILAALEPVLLSVAEETRAATLDDLGTAALRAELAALHHETQYTRLFRS
ncbi:MULTISPECIES: urease accessory protein UreF [unclassified Acidisoma]|jgi:urease accessory protein|uniref:urease accessory protein UreF n=1 Tax=unclassified Acidisoma TaxID=2634065 RepID=UPI00131DBF77|nr:MULTISPECIES: urease accessory UreF family protein [unclassified Acidisoma]